MKMYGNSDYTRREFLVNMATTGAALTLLPYGCKNKAGKSEAGGGIKTNEIATVVGASSAPGSIILWRYDGKSGYVPIFEQGGLEGNHCVAIGDIDNDGKNEVVAASRGGSYVIRHRDGRFVSEKLDEYERDARSVVIGDVDNDGRNEVLILENGGKYIGPPAAKLHVYRSKNGRYEKEVWPGLLDRFRHNGIIADVDRDGLNEVLSLAGIGGLAVSENKDGKFRIADVLSRANDKRFISRRAEAYRQICGYESELLPLLDVGVNQQLDFGDLIGDGSRCILLSGFDGKFQVIRHTGRGFETLYISDMIWDKEKGEYPRSCGIGDVNNDGRNEAVLGAKEFMVFGYNGGTFRKLWESERLERKETKMNVANMCIADSDGDGLNELIYSQPVGLPETWKSGDDPPVYMHRLAVMKNTSKGDWELHRTWESDAYPGYFSIAVGDIDGN